VGEHKLQSYGADFLEVLRLHGVPACAGG